MAEELKALIEKIQEEGIRAAEGKASAIENEAKKKALEIVEGAKIEAAELLELARSKITKEEESSRKALTQAGRDLLIGLRKEITDVLERIIRSHVHKALSTEELARMISGLVKDAQKGSEVIISLKKEDVEKLEKTFLSDLRDELKKGVKLRTQDDISAGFIISYDGGRSSYDFTDKALAKYISAYLRPKLADMLNEAL